MQQVETTERLEPGSVADIGMMADTVRPQRLDTEQASAEVDRLIAKIVREDTKRKKLGWSIGICYLTIMVLMVVAAVASSLRHHHFPMDMLGSVGTWAGLGAMGVAATNTQKKAAKELAQYDDLRGVGKLTEALEYGDKGVRADVERALERLLPRLRASDAQLLDASQHRILTKRLREKNVTLAIAILKAFEQVGGESELDRVEALAARDDQSIDPELRAAALACLPALRANASAAQAKAMLLRASAAAEVAPGTLLRPATATAPEDSHELLRADGSAAALNPVAGARTEVAPQQANLSVNG